VNTFNDFPTHSLHASQPQAPSLAVDIVPRHFETAYDQAAAQDVQIQMYAIDKPDGVEQALPLISGLPINAPLRRFTPSDIRALHGGRDKMIVGVRATPEARVAFNARLKPLLEAARLAMQATEKRQRP
jgi:hypothetical protein